MPKLKVRPLTMSPIVDRELLERVMQAARELKEEREAAGKKSALNGGFAGIRKPVKAKRSMRRKTLGKR